MRDFLINLLLPVDEAQLLFTLLILAFIVKYTPAKYPFNWLETYFHELSHGLAALLTFGQVVRIQLLFNGAGKCFTRGGWAIPILFAGYAGAVGWGLALYYAGWAADHDRALIMHLWLLVLVGFSVLFWVRDLRTIAIMAIIASLFALPLLYPQWQAAHILLQFSGLYVMLSALRAPLALIDGKQIGDGAELQKRTLLHEYIWIFLWVALALVALLYVIQSTLSGSWEI